MPWPAGFRVKVFGSNYRQIYRLAEYGRFVTANRATLDSTALGSVLRRNFRGFSVTSFAGASMTAAFTFPGQGSQTVGMGKALADAFPAARAIFEEVDGALAERLTSIIWEGPAETLQLTENAQPALMAVSLATLRVLETEAGFSVARDAAFVAGHSLGEYSALAAAGSLSISDTARLLRTRGLAMQKAVPVGVGAMAALLGLDYEAAVAVASEAAQDQACQAANDNGGGQVVVSGDKAAVERALEIAKAKGAKRAMLLPVSAPFHCRLMQPAADVMAQALAGVTIRKPVVPLVSNVLAAPITDPDEIRRRLIEQVTGTVRWRESVAYMASHGVTRFFEIGAGKVLSGLVKRIADGAIGISVSGPNDIAAAREALAAAQTA
jgi:[acyl-carrier-protein] S-malonyltransferase